MGLPHGEQWRGGEADGKEAPSAAAAGCRTPGPGGSGQQAGRRTTAECPAPPRKRRAPAGEVSQRRRDFYNGADVEAFFAANNL